MPYTVTVGRDVSYRNAAGRIQHAIVTAVTSQTIVDLRVGPPSASTKLVVAGATKVARKGATVGWF